MQDITYLHSGGGMTAEQACIMNAVDAISQMHLHGDVVFALTDSPGCTDAILRSFAVASNDSLPDEQRQALLGLADAIYLAHPMKDADARRKWRGAFVEWVQRRIEEGRLDPERGSLFGGKSLAKVIDDFLDENKPYDVEDEQAEASAVACCAAHACDPGDRVQLLAELLLFYDKVRADEGAMLDEWEDQRVEETWTYEEAEEHHRLQQALENSYNADYYADGSHNESQRTKDLRTQLAVHESRIRERIRAQRESAGQAH